MRVKTAGAAAHHGTSRLGGRNTSLKLGCQLMGDRCHTRTRFKRARVVQAIAQGSWALNGR